MQTAQHVQTGPALSTYTSYSPVCMHQLHDDAKKGLITYFLCIRGIDGLEGIDLALGGIDSQRQLPGTLLGLPVPLLVICAQLGLLQALNLHKPMQMLTCCSLAV